jgi:DHA1 family bicyclomycin/chloramphenicol resistance-like MFS transporter
MARVSISSRKMTWLIAGLSSLGPFAIDTYLPAFAAIGESLNATDVQMQFSLAVYMASYAFMNLWHGAVSDTVGRRPILLFTLILFSLASLGAASSQSIEQLWFWRVMQGLVGGAGMVIGRAIIRDVFDGGDAQRQISKVMMIFSLAPIVAPIIGGWIFELAGWRAIFVFLALYSLGVAIVLAVWMPETLPDEKRQSLKPAALLRGYGEIFSMPEFWRTSLALSMLFQGFFLYILSSPIFGRVHLGLEPTQFFWIFIPGVIGTILGSAVSARIAGKLSGGTAIAAGYIVMATTAIANLLLNWNGTAAMPWAVAHLTCYNFGLGLAMAALQVRLFDLAPTRRGMVSSCHAALQSAGLGLSAAFLIPLLWVSTFSLASGMLGFVCLSLLLYGTRIRRAS